MARSLDDEEACKGSNSEQEEEEEEEALSLNDLPLNLMINEEKCLQSSKESTQVEENEEEFNFGSWGGSILAESEMCAADDVFFKGQILPLRHSVSSDSGLARFQHDISRNTSRCLSRSESMDRSSSLMGGLTSINSSRSSSTRSHYSSSSSSSASSFTISTRNSKPRIRNQFHTFPSPKPQIRVSNARPLANGSISRSQKSTLWDFFRLGLVRAPEIELQDLKFRSNINSSVSRNSVSRNSSSGSSSTNSSSSIKNYISNCKINSSNVAPAAAKNKQDLSLGKKQQKRQSFLDKRKGLFNGCKCSIAAVETVPLNNIVIFKRNIAECGSNNNNESSSSTAQDMQKKLQELKIKQKMKEKQRGKQAMSRHRTFEWLKELSHGSCVDELET